MPHTFDSVSFGELGADAERLSAQAAEHERRLAALVESVESNGQDNFLATLRELCVDARHQRQIADTLRARLLGDTASTTVTAEKRPLVLIVDDSPDSREMAAMLLETSGFDAITAGNGLEGVIVAHYTRPAVVIMDVAMPVLDGVQATKLLKASRVTQDIKVIAHTAKMNLDEEPTMARLFADVLRKPASPETFVSLVQRCALPSEPASI